VTSPLTKVTIWSPHVRLRVHGTQGNTPNKDSLYKQDIMFSLSWLL
jgi:hypothetical protein